jgi:putative endonuclease
MAQHHITGKQGEDMAVDHLLEKGHRLIARNWRYLKSELDIITEADGFLVVTEVKTRSTSTFGEPEDFVDRKKQKNIIKAANAYVIEKGIEKEVRFDIVSIVTNGSETSITHIEDAFYPLV